MAKLARRALMLALLLGIALAVPAAPREAAPFDTEQSQRFRAWFTVLVAEQLRQGPNPRWSHRDCAGLVRFAVDEALRTHDTQWRQQNGLLQRRLPPELVLSPEQRAWRQNWRRADGSRGAYAAAFALVQENSTFVSRDLHQAQPGDLLYFDQGDDQHLMIWMGDYIAYHTGKNTKHDSGLRAVSAHQLFTWRDVRWQPRSDNPNFVGIFRLRFLSR
ncbi:DUF1175 family protein [Tahibacter amnicola]|uniref:DUF1175 family protein n=1 Tax=Tahibacter amnicola TaxID=2976241 RepID=A0ABY6BCM8_9GAMM|nr:DUF1175 family protein [Tahibacter amnicola]UXI67590.1 DUF1175 family protein [Tahibacter amnicola]